MQLACIGTDLATSPLLGTLARTHRMDIVPFPSSNVVCANRTALAPLPAPSESTWLAMSQPHGSWPSPHSPSSLRSVFSHKRKRQMNSHTTVHSVPITPHLTTGQDSPPTQPKPLSDTKFNKLIADLAFDQDAPHCHTARTSFHFAMTEQAAIHNASILGMHGFDLEKAINSQDNSPISYGSEFRHWTKLEPLLHRHPLWNQMKTILRDGATFPLRKISAEERASDKDFMIARGNHKSVGKNLDLVRELINDDVTHGYALPLPIDTALVLPNSSIAPIGVVEQETLNETGERIPKFRMTHDQSFPGPSGTSVNKRVITEELPPCLFGFCLQRILHYIVDTRRRLPTVRILIGKYDIKSAYRRAHLSAETAVESLMIFENILYLALRMTFGGSPCPSQWSCISETMCDLANDLIQCDKWKHRELFSINQARIPSPRRLPDEILLKMNERSDRGRTQQSTGQTTGGVTSLEQTSKESVGTITRVRRSS